MFLIFFSTVIPLGYLLIFLLNKLFHPKIKLSENLVKHQVFDINVHLIKRKSLEVELFFFFFVEDFN